MKAMMYTLELSGHDAEGNAGTDRFGGLFRSIEDAVAHGIKARTGTLSFKPEVLRVRDQEGQEQRRQDL